MFQATSAPVAQEEDQTLRDGPVVTPRPPARSAGRYSRNITEESRLSLDRNSSEPLPLGVQLEQFSCDYAPKSEEATARETVGSDSRRAPEAWCSGKGTLQAQRAEDWCFQTETLQTQMPNEATDGLAPSVLDSFLGAMRGASYEFPPASEEDPRRETPGSDSHVAPQARCSRKGTLQAQRAEDCCSQKGTFHTHKYPTRLPTCWHRRFLPFFGRS